MKQDFVVSADALGRQRRASDPSVSAWVSANAGAGKTKVLTDRVIRLMLAGAPPARILCLTFTKAAAAEMTIRVFETLGQWVTLEDVALRDELAKLTGAKPDRATLGVARRLFARAVETPGGLKIETIHAFCERILHLVPFEANVPASFQVLDEAQSAEILAVARGRVLTDAVAADASAADASDADHRHRELADAYGILGLSAQGDTLTALLDRAAGDERIPSDPAELGPLMDEVARALGIAPGQGPGIDPDEVRRAMLEDGIAAAEWPALAAALRRSGKANDAKRAASLEAALAGEIPSSRLEAYLKLFFTTENEPRSDKDLVTQSAEPGLRERLGAERDRLARLRDRLLAAETVERTRALHRLAVAVRARADALKAAQGALDFADLIAKTRELLERDAAAWVLYRLDRGIDHVLVDEAQDTNPDQWRILRLLTQDFTAGAGRPSRAPRTLFAVGDPKQSIYSFQGADPRWFEDSRRHWMGRSRDAELRFEDVRLDLSFRSAPTILQAVDATFGVAAHYRGLSFDDSAVGTRHQSARPRAPGHVEIWPTATRGPKGAEPDAWVAPVDLPDSKAPAVVVAERIAAAVAHWTRTGEDGRVWRPGEILILSAKRGPAFFATIRALKAAGIPVAGADRFQLGSHIAVADLLAAGAAALLPANDLVLATALKSPLAGLSEDDLMRLAMDRREREPLVAAIRRHAEAGDPAGRAAVAALARWRDLAHGARPFDFYAALLGPEGGRKRLIDRLGSEAADAIDAFLCHALAFEGGPETPSLATFLARLETADQTIKRDLGAAGGEVRVMTVHGAKGLEAPLVIVLDSCDLHGREPALVPVRVAGRDEPVPVWSTGRRSDPAGLAEARRVARELRVEEHNRLLYVAMTRARDRLVVAPFTGTREQPEAWCAMMRQGLVEAGLPLLEVEAPHGPAAIWRSGPAHEAGPDAAGRAEEAETEIPAWLFAMAEPEPEPPPPLRPSSALAAADRSGRADRRMPADRIARRRGTLVHALIDHLADGPQADTAEAAARYLAARALGFDARERARIAAEALAVVAHPDLAALFGPGARGEVPLAGTVRLASGATRAVSGQADRMVVGNETVLLADFKTGAPDPSGTPGAYLVQLALYRALLAEIHPGRRIRTLIVWTAGPTIVEPSSTELDAALDALS